jgi:hypothetical protein
MNRSGTTTRPAAGKSVMLRWLSHTGVFGLPNPDKLAQMQRAAFG